jgi:hypothetical protein
MSQSDGKFLMDFLGCQIPNSGKDKFPDSSAPFSSFPVPTNSTVTQPRFPISLSSTFRLFTSFPSSSSTPLLRMSDMNRTLIHKTKKIHSRKSFSPSKRTPREIGCENFHSISFFLITRSGRKKVKTQSIFICFVSWGGIRLQFPSLSSAAYQRLLLQRKRERNKPFLKQNPVTLCLKIDFMQSIDFSSVSSKRKIASLKICLPYGSAIKMNFLSISVLLSLLCCSFVRGEFAGELKTTNLRISTFPHWKMVSR